MFFEVLVRLKSDNTVRIFIKIPITTSNSDTFHPLIP